MGIIGLLSRQGKRRWRRFVLLYHLLPFTQSETDPNDSTGVLLAKRGKPFQPEKMTVKLTVKLSDKPLHQGTHQNSRFCVYPVQKRSDGEHGRREERSKSAVYPCYGRMLYYSSAGRSFSCIYLKDLGENTMTVAESFEAMPMIFNSAAAA